MNYKISLSSVNIPDEAYPLMEQVMREGKIGQSEYIEQFEQAICDYTGAKYCIAVCNGTMADAVAVAALKYIYPKLKKIIVPALTFIAQPNSVLYNCVDIAFQDVEENWLLKPQGTFLKDDGEIIFYTDLMGRVCGENCFLEDACEAFGSKLNGVLAGRFGLMGTYSFYPSHTITTGEGGAIVTDNEHCARLCRSIRAHGSLGSDPREKFHFPLFGFNAKMTTMQAVMGIALMKNVDEAIKKRRLIFSKMRSIFGKFVENIAEEIVPHGYPIEFESEEARDKAMDQLLEASIECRKFFSCIPLDEPYYKINGGDFPVAQHISHTHLYLPCTQNMTEEDVVYIVEQVSTLNGRVL